MCWCAGCSPRNGWTALFLVTSLLTSATGCLFPLSHGVGIVSLIVLAVAILARYIFSSRRRVAPGLCGTTAIAIYLNLLVLIAQILPKVPVLKAKAATQSEPLESPSGVRVTEKPYSSRWRQGICRTSYHGAMARSTTRNGCAAPCAPRRWRHEVGAACVDACALPPDRLWLEPEFDRNGNVIGDGLATLCGWLVAVLLEGIHGGGVKRSRS